MTLLQISKHNRTSKAASFCFGAVLVVLMPIYAAAQHTAAAKGDRALGEYLSNTCVGCHQISGKSNAGVPPIVGWPEDQFIAVMKSYKEKYRGNQVMQTIAAGLSEEDVAGLAAYFTTIRPANVQR